MGPSVTSQTPFSALVISAPGPRLPGISLPFRRTALACGALIRNTTRWSGSTSGDTTTGPCGPRPSGGAGWAERIEAARANAGSARVEFFIEAPFPSLILLLSSRRVSTQHAKCVRYNSVRIVSARDLINEAGPGEAVLPRIGSYRWRICALLFFATTINYVDRQVLGVLAPELQRVIGWNEIQYSNLVNAFQAAYAIGLLVAGGFMDRVGTRIGYAVAIGVWSIATMGTSLVHTVLGFGIARFVLGIGESGNFPASIKTVAEWFPKKERAFATGIFNSGANIGAVVAPIMVPWLTVHYGWQAAFIVTGSLSALWLIPWLIIYRPPHRHPRLSKSELGYILSDPPEPVEKIPW